MAADTKQLDDRLDKLEEKLKATFNIIEKRFDELEHVQSSAPKIGKRESYDTKKMEERFDKMDDKLKLTFDQIEKRFNDIQHTTPKMQVQPGGQSHKMVEMEERFGKLEEKLKLTFTEIDKRLVQMQQQPHYSAEDRIEELEDLLLLLQLESTKIREKVGDGLDFGIVPSAPDISERLTRMESEIASHVSTTAMPAAIDDTKLAALEEKINTIGKPAVQAVDDSLKETIQALEKKVNTLEALLAQRGREQLEEDDLLTDVQSILRGR